MMPHGRKKKLITVEKTDRLASVSLELSDFTSIVVVKSISVTVNKEAIILRNKLFIIQILLTLFFLYCIKNNLQFLKKENI